MGVGPHLALVDDRRLVRVHVLDRVLDGDDVVLAVLVDPIDHGGQGRGFARPGRSRDEHQTLGKLHDVLHDRGQAQIIETADVGGDVAEGGRHGAALLEDVHADTAHAFHAEGHVQLVVLLELLFLLIREDGVDQLLGGLRAELLVFGGGHDPVDAQHGGNPRRDVQVRRVPLEHQAQRVSMLTMGTSSFQDRHSQDFKRTSGLPTRPEAERPPFFRHLP
jgi:hypothetical protein